MKNINIRKIIYHVRYRYITMNNVVMVVALLVGIGWAWASIGAMQRNFILQKEVDDKFRQQKLLELEKTALDYQQKYYKTNEYQELAVRERLGLAFPGENVLLLPPNSEAAKQVDAVSQPGTTQPSTGPPMNNFQQWMNFLFGGNHQSDSLTRN
jgi:hypothetical protein